MLHPALCLLRQKAMIRDISEIHWRVNFRFSVNSRVLGPFFCLCLGAIIFGRRHSAWQTVLYGIFCRLDFYILKIVWCSNHLIFVFPWFFPCCIPRPRSTISSLNLGKNYLQKFKGFPESRDAIPDASSPHGWPFFRIGQLWWVWFPWNRKRLPNIFSLGMDFPFCICSKPRLLRCYFGIEKLLYYKQTWNNPAKNRRQWWYNVLLVGKKLSGHFCNSVIFLQQVYFLPFLFLFLRLKFLIEACRFHSFCGAEILPIPFLLT